MSGIDTSAAALQANRLSALQPLGGRPGTGATQTGVSALAGGVPNLPAAAGVPQQQQASTQTELSAVALALDAIQRSGGEATPAVVGTAPVWPTPEQVQAAADNAVVDVLATLADALSSDAQGDVAGATAAMLADVAEEAANSGSAVANGANGAGVAGGNGAAETGSARGTAETNGAATSNGAGATTGASAATQAAATTDPVAAALASSLQRMVSGSGLFYESHLAQWLLGQRSPAELAAEPQNRLAASPAAQLPLDWRRSAGDADDVFWSDPHTLDASPQQQADAARAANPAAQSMLLDELLDVVHPPLAQSASGAPGDPPAAPTNAQGQLLAVHPAVIPLLRQQLDVLATGEFRWTGEAWPGARLDWSIRQEDDDARRGHGSPDLDAIPWRTRLTLSLPSLGIVDAELTLVGATLAVRVQASGDGAARLSADGDALRGRMAAAGIELGALSILEVGSAASGSGGADAARAAQAYASAAGSTAANNSVNNAAPDASSPAVEADDFDWEAR